MLMEILVLFEFKNILFLVIHFWKFYKFLEVFFEACFLWRLYLQMDYLHCKIEDYELSSWWKIYVISKIATYYQITLY